jgi:hypothetical protein
MHVQFSLKYHVILCHLFARKAFSKHECSANGNCTPLYVHLRISTKECQITKKIYILKKLQVNSGTTVSTVKAFIFCKHVL